VWNGNPHFRRRIVRTIIKWLLILVGGLVVLIIVALLILPRFVDVERYKPSIEKRVSEATGCPFTLGGDVSLSLFPWAGVSLSDIHLGNPPGFQEKDLVAVKSFAVRVKLLPLFSKDVQVKQFIVDTPRIVLEMNKDGRGNWEGIGQPSEQIPSEGEAEKEKAPESEPPGDLPIKSLAVGEFAIKNASLLWIDRVQGDRKEVTDVTLRLEDVSLDRAIRVALSGKAVGHPFSLEGELGPVGRELGTGAIPLNLAIRAAKELNVNVTGTLVDPATHPQFELAFETDLFSPKKLLAALGQAFSVETADPNALSAMAVKAKVKGDPQKISILGGVLHLDDSQLTFSARAKDFTKPDIAFDLNLDEMDLDRYLTPSVEKQARDVEKEAEPEKSEPKQTDYAPLRKLVLDGSVQIGKLKAYGASIEDLTLKVSGKNGVFRFEPLTLELYKGSVAAKGSVDVHENIPKTQLALDAGGIQAGPLLRDVLSQDSLEGRVKAKVTIAMAGDDSKGIKQTLNGEGDFLFKDGGIKGIDLTAMVRNVEAAFGLAKAGEEKARTDFSELHAPFTITNGVVKTAGTTLTSPALRAVAAGEADLVKETLNFRVEPEFVATLKGQGDIMERGGFKVPVVVTGSFAAPKFRPDLKGIIRKELKEKLPEASEWMKVLPGETKQGDDSGSLEEKAEDLLKQIPFGR
jgi:AsmA protein